MALTSYADQEYYEKVSGVITTDDLERRLYIASRHIDTLTFNRIVARGFENLTEFQKRCSPSGLSVNRQILK